MSNSYKPLAGGDAPNLPIRKNFGTLDEIQRLAPLRGHDVGDNAKMLSANEWDCDLWRAEEVQEALGLSDTQLVEMLAALVERNRSIWGPYCMAKMPSWTAGL